MSLLPRLLDYKSAKSMFYKNRLELLTAVNEISIWQTHVTAEDCYRYIIFGRFATGLASSARSCWCCLTIIMLIVVSDLPVCLVVNKGIANL